MVVAQVRNERANLAIVADACRTLDLPTGPRAVAFLEVIALGGR